MLGLIKHNIYTNGVIFFVWFGLCFMVLLITGFVASLTIFSVAAFGTAVTTPLMSTGMVKKEILSRWSVQELVLPIKKYRVVATKYVVHCIYLIPCLIAIFVIFFASPVSRSNGATAELSLFLFLGVCVSLLYGALYIPCLYILKEADPNIVSPLCSLVAAGIFVLSVNITRSYGFSLSTASNMWIYSIALFVVLMYLASSMLSWYVYKKKEF